MDDVDLYGDLDNFEHKVENEKASEDLVKLQDKYDTLLKENERLQRRNRILEEKVVNMKLNFDSLVQTSLAEIARKDKQILELRKEKDNIAFRRGPPRTSNVQNTPRGNPTYSAPPPSFTQQRPPVSERNESPHRRIPDEVERKPTIDFTQNRAIIPESRMSSAREEGEIEDSKEFITDARDKLSRPNRQGERMKEADPRDHRSSDRSRDSRTERGSRYERDRDRKRDRDLDRNRDQHRNRRSRSRSRDRERYRSDRERNNRKRSRSRDSHSKDSSSRKRHSEMEKDRDRHSKRLKQNEDSRSSSSRSIKDREFERNSRSSSRGTSVSSAVNEKIQKDPLISQITRGSPSQQQTVDSTKDRSPIIDEIRNGELKRENQISAKLDDKEKTVPQPMDTRLEAEVKCNSDPNSESQSSLTSEIVKETSQEETTIDQKPINDSEAEKCDPRDIQTTSSDETSESGLQLNNAKLQLVAKINCDSTSPDARPDLESYPAYPPATKAQEKVTIETPLNEDPSEIESHVLDPVPTAEPTPPPTTITPDIAEPKIITTAPKPVSPPLLSFAGSLERLKKEVLIQTPTPKPNLTPSEDTLPSSPPANHCETPEIECLSTRSEQPSLPENSLRISSEIKSTMGSVTDPSIATPQIHIPNPPLASFAGAIPLHPHLHLLPQENHLPMMVVPEGAVAEQRDATVDQEVATEPQQLPLLPTPKAAAVPKPKIALVSGKRDPYNLEEEELEEKNRRESNLTVENLQKIDQEQERGELEYIREEIRKIVGEDMANDAGLLESFKEKERIRELKRARELEKERAALEEESSIKVMVMGNSKYTYTEGADGKKVMIVSRRKKKKVKTTAIIPQSSE